MKKLLVIAVILLGFSSRLFSQSDTFIGEIKLFAGNFAPKGWMFCQGQTLPVSQWVTAYSILGTTYGGDGRNTFQLPDLRGRVPVGVGLGSGMSTNVALGSKIGSETNMLQVTGVQPSVSGGLVVPVATGNVPVNNREPSLGLNYIICLQGLYPQRN